MAALFDWSDPFDLESQLTEEERMVRKTAHDYAQARLGSRVLEAFRHEKTDPSIFREMGDLGFLGPTDFAGLRRVGPRLCRLWAHSARSGARRFRLPLDDERAVFARHGPDRDFWLGRPETEISAKARDRRVDRLLRPHGAEPRLRPRLDGDAGEKGRGRLFARRAPRPGFPTRRSPTCFLVWAKTEDGAIRGFLLEKGWKGLSAPAIHGKVGLRASITGEIVLDGCFVPEENLLPKVSGLKGPFTCLNSARFGIAWGALGAAEACYATARQYVLDRKQFGRPLAANQLIQKKLADMATEIALGLQSCLRLGRMKEEGHPPVELTSILKRNSCGKALDIARACRDMLGGNGISDEFGVARHLVNLEVVNTYEGTHDVHALIIGRAITGIAAFAN